MDLLFGSLKHALKQPSILIDNQVFRLHYKVTMCILVAFSIAVTSRQYLGNPIECISSYDIPPNVLETFCWIHSTFSVEKAWMKNVGKEIPYPGVDKYVDSDTRVYHAYYQWVCFVLFLQAILFYIPHYFWKCIEGGRIKVIVQDLNSTILDQEKKGRSLNYLINYMITNFHNNQAFAALYFLSELLNAVNVFGQMYLMDIFLGGSFSSYGIDVIRFAEWDWSLRYDPMVRVFPRVTKCTFHNYGSSGDVQKYDAMCILPINIMNEKIYVFLWFWFVIMAVLSCAAIAYRILLFARPKARILCLESRANLTRKIHIKNIVQKCKMGDWFLVYLLCKNMDSVHFKEFMAEFHRKLVGEPTLSRYNSTDV